MFRFLLHRQSGQTSDESMYLLPQQVVTVPYPLSCERSKMVSFALLNTEMMLMSISGFVARFQPQVARHGGRSLTEAVRDEMIISPIEESAQA